MIAFWELVRPRLVSTVLFTIIVAAWATASTTDWLLVSHVLLGAAFVIVGSIAINQAYEHRSDAKMARTAGRPVPSGRLTVRHAALFGGACSLSGFAYLGLLTTPMVAAAAAVSWVFYVLLYTPLKTVTVWQTPIGAVSGAMPIMIGAAAADALSTPPALALFGIMYFWQFPHTMAIAWLHKEDYARAGVKVAAVVDPSGRLAAWVAIVGAAVLLVVGAAPAIWLERPWLYVGWALLLGIGYLWRSIAFALTRTNRTARRLLFASLIYLPLMLGGFLLAVKL
jgi:protoheme IX farnesyltransferase